MISFGSGLYDYRFAGRKEYIITAGGNYCSSSLAGNTRKYHGLIVADKRIYLSCLEEQVNGRLISVARYVGALRYEGLRYLYGFELYPPRFTYFVDGASVTKTIEFDGQLTVRYDVAGEIELRLRPLITDRGYHEARYNVRIEAVASTNGFRAGKLSMRSSLPFVEDPQTYYNLSYERDEERGYDHVEDLFSPGYFHGNVKDCSVALGASVDGVSGIPVSAAAPVDEIGALELAADSFLVDDTIYAGYHWFSEPWGRDTFISLPGLLLEREKFDEAKRVFRHFAGLIKGGLIPNRIPGGYNSSDTPLWFIYALGKYFENKKDDEFYREAGGYVETILSGYPDSEVAKLDGSLIAVEPGTTWMDTPFTPRKGKPVEINALWVYALRLAEKMEIGLPARSAAALREFDRFWNEKKGCLFDVLDPDDGSVRPNQAIAIALGIVEGDRAKSSMELMRKELLTPYGLRTLSPLDSRYKGKFCGDNSYHNGCVWPWLMGFYVEAALKQGQSKDMLASLIEPLLVHTHDAGLGTISEIFDGDAPHRPNGCISQAWSVAEVLRAYKKIKGLIP